MTLRTAANSKAERKRSTLTLSKVRSALTNGSSILAGIDHRQAWVRRLRDLQQLHLSDAGGETNVSEAEHSLIRRASMLELQLEMLDSRFAENNGEATLVQLQAYTTVTNTLRRTLEAVGLQRRSKNVTPTLDQYLAARTAAE